MGVRQTSPEEETLRVVVDDRERPCGLAKAVAALWAPTCEGRLPAGDVDIGGRVLVERKSVVDFVASLSDGRLFRQARALSQVAFRPLLVVEGEDGFDALGIPPNSLRGILVTLLVGYRIPLLRTGSVAETATFVATIAKQETRRQARFRNGTSRDVTRGRATLDVLGAIPGVGDERARQLVKSFGSIEEIAAAPPERLEDVPGIGPAVAGEIRRVCGQADGADPRGGPAVSSLRAKK